MDAMSMLMKFSFADKAQMMVAIYMPTKIIMPMMARICLVFFILGKSPFSMVVQNTYVYNEIMVADFLKLVK